MVIGGLPEGRPHGSTFLKIPDHDPWILAAARATAQASAPRRQPHPPLSYGPCPACDARVRK
jgi:hypothetical protein